MANKIFEPIIASAACVVPEKAITAAFHCNTCSYEFAVKVESNAAKTFKPLCVQCSSDELEGVVGASFRKVPEASLNFLECSDCKTYTIFSDRVAASADFRKSKHSEVCCVTCGSELHFKTPALAVAASYDDSDEDEDADLGGDAVDNDELSELDEDDMSDDDFDEDMDDGDDDIEAGVDEDEDDYEDDTEEAGIDEDDDSDTLDELTEESEFMEDSDDKDMDGTKDSDLDDVKLSEMSKVKSAAIAKRQRIQASANRLAIQATTDPDLDKSVGGDPDAVIDDQEAQAKKTGMTEPKGGALEVKASDDDAAYQPTKVSSDEPKSSESDQEKLAKATGLTEPKEMTDKKLLGIEPGDEKPAADLPQLQNETNDDSRPKFPSLPVSAGVQMELHKLLNNDDGYVFARVSDRSIGCFKGNVMVAFLNRDDSKVQAAIYDSKNYINGLNLAAGKNNIDTVLSQAQFDVVKVDVPASVITAQAVTAAVDSEKAKIRTELSKETADVKHCIEIAMTGINKGFFGKKGDSLVAALHREMTKAGFRNPERVLSNAFRDGADPYIKAVIEVASDLLSKPVEVRNGYASALGTSEYVVSAADCDKDSEDEDIKEEALLQLEAKLEQPVVASLIETASSASNGSQKNIHAIVARVGGRNLF